MPTRDEYLASLHRDNELILDAMGAAGNLTQPVDGTDWVLADLIGHLGTIQHYVANTLIKRDGPGDRPPPPDDRAQWADWFADGSARLEAELARAADDEPVWNWSVRSPDVAAFWVRRMAQEAAVHRYDAELAATGTAEAIDPVMAKDGLDEYFDMFLSRVEDRAPIRIGNLAVQLRTLEDDIDAQGNWMVRCGDGPPVVTREHAKGDVALQGPANALLLAVWGRVEPDEMGLELQGDPANWARFHTATAL